MAIITISNAGGNWNATTAWVGGVVPTAVDDVVATATSGPLSLNTTAVAKSVNFTNYVNTFSLTSGTLSIAGNLTFSTGMTITGTSSILAFTASATWTSNSKTWTGNYLVNTAALTITLADAAVINGSVTHTSGGTTHTINGFTLSVNGNITASSGRTFTGTTKYIFSTTTTQTITVSGTFQSNIDINASGTVTFGTFNYSTGTLTYITGTVITTGSTLTLLSATTLNTGGMTWNNVQLNTATQTHTLTSDLNISGTFSLLASANIVNGAFNINISGSLTSSFAISGTATIIMNGTGTWSGAGAVRNNLTFNTAGTITISGTVSYSTGTLTYTAGTMITTGSTLTISSTSPTNLNTSGMIWDTVKNTISTTTTLLSDLYCVAFTWQGGNAWTLNGAFNVYISTNITGTAGAGTCAGTATLVMTGTGTISNISSTSNLSNPLTFNTAGTITISGTFNYGVTAGAILTYIAGTIVAKGSTLNINGSTVTLINMHKINFDTVTISSGFTVTMNEFFSGSPNQPVKVQASSTTNYGITFQNGFEKIAKYVKVSNMTLTNTAASRGSLLILNNKGKYFRGSNNIGNIRYTNSSPNGISKGNPTIPNSMTAPIGGYVSDPVFN